MATEVITRGVGHPFSVFDGANYDLDLAGNRTDKIDLLTNAETFYGYDATYQLLSATGGSTESYTYDAVGNRLSSAAGSFSYNSSNELITGPDTSYTYDANGNMLTRTDTSGTTQYTWNFENQLTSVTLPGTGGTTTFKYDPFGRRIQKAGPLGTTNFAYDGANIVAEYDSAGAELAEYVQGAGVDEPLAMFRGGNTYYYSADGLGSVTSLEDGSGSVVASYTYDSFGNLTSSEPTLFNPFRYTGREWDKESNLYYYRARYYDSITGRFLSEDPLGFLSGNTDFYAYANNSPTNNIDPSGNCPWCIGGAMGFATDLTLQLIKQHGNWRCINVGQLVASTAIGALTGGLGGEGLNLGLSGLENTTKGAIGEGLSMAKNFLSGSTYIGRQVSARSLSLPGLTTVFDSVWESASEGMYFVESKFGTSGLSRAQRAAASALGDAYHVERWTYPFFGNLGGAAGGTLGGMLGSQMSGRGCGCQQ